MPGRVGISDENRSRRSAGGNVRLPPMTPLRAIGAVLVFTYRRISMAQRSPRLNLPRGPLDEVRPTPVAGRRVCLSILSWPQAGFLAMLVGTLGVLNDEPTPHEGGSPSWSTSTGHPRGARAVAFSPDCRRLATGGAIAMFEVASARRGTGWASCDFFHRRERCAHEPSSEAGGRGSGEPARRCRANRRAASTAPARDSRGREWRGLAVHSRLVRGGAAAANLRPNGSAHRPDASYKRHVLGLFE